MGGYMNKFEKKILFLKILLKLEEKKNNRRSILFSIMGIAAYLFVQCAAPLLSKVEIFSIGLLACVILLFLMFLWRN